MSVRLKKSLCHYCLKEGCIQCSICGRHYCQTHGKHYHRACSGLYYCRLSLNVCLDCQKTLLPLDLGELLAKVEISHIRYA